MQRRFLLSTVILLSALALAACGYADDADSGDAASPDQARQPSYVIQPAAASNAQMSSDRAISAEVYPAADGSGINVQGFGLATAPVDLATLQFLYGPNYYCEGCVPPDGSMPETPEVTLEMLQPVVDALVGIGVSPDDIEASIIPGYGYGYDRGYYEKYGYATEPATDFAPTPGPYPYGGGTGQILVRVGGPSSERLLEIVTTANDAAYASGVLMPYSTGALFTVNDCSGLEQQSIGDAVDDARARAELVGGAIGATPGGVTWISMYPSYDPYGGSPCGETAYAGPITYYPPYDPNLPLEVRIMTSVNVTFALE